MVQHAANQQYQLGTTHVSKLHSIHNKAVILCIGKVLQGRTVKTAAELLSTPYTMYSCASSSCSWH